MTAAALGEKRGIDKRCVVKGNRAYLNAIIHSTFVLD